MNRTLAFIQLKKVAYNLADERGFLQKGIKTYDLSLNLKEREITESIIRGIWDYDKTYNVNITDGQETRLIMQNCLYAGMYAAKYVNMSAADILSIFYQNKITEIEEFVGQDLGFDGRESFVSSLVARGLVQDVFNDNVYLYDRSSAAGQWEYYKDMACVMFELGILYYVNR